MEILVVETICESSPPRPPTNGRSHYVEAICKIGVCKKNKDIKVEIFSRAWPRLETALD
jgi:hypothetical protein